MVLLMVFLRKWFLTTLLASKWEGDQSGLEDLCGTGDLR
jgi:hypothetical protein